MSSVKDSKKDPKKSKSAKDVKPAQTKKEPKESKSSASVAVGSKKGKPERPKGPARFGIYFKETVAKELTAKFGYKSPMQVPRIEKIVLNMGVGEAVADKKIMDFAVADMTKISGQRPLVTKSRKAIANFKIREGYPVGCKVTLRGARMYEFLDRLVSVAMPRIRDFRGISGRSFDGRGNYNMGVKEQIIFPEIEYDKIDAIRGMNITISTTAKSDEEGRALLAAFKFPFRS
jgi:large subunit ribosomal protein L5